MKYEAIYPDGRRETLCGCREFSFNWQGGFRLKRPVKMSQGHEVDREPLISNNSTKNKYDGSEEGCPLGRSDLR